MWIGRPLLTRSVANRRRKSCGVTHPASSGCSTQGIAEFGGFCAQRSGIDDFGALPDRALEKKRLRLTRDAFVRVKAGRQRHAPPVPGEAADDGRDHMNSSAVIGITRSRSVLDGTTTNTATMSPLGRAYWRMLNWDSSRSSSQRSPVRPKVSTVAHCQNAASSVKVTLSFRPVDSSSTPIWHARAARRARRHRR